MGTAVPKSEAPPAAATQHAEQQGSSSRAHPAVAGRPSALKVGTVLQGRYRIQGIIGVGGMSTVYRARDLRFPGVERLCAVKEMFNVAAEPRLRQMRLTNFQREAALLATLAHPVIPSIYDFFDVHGTIYLVLELVQGQDLETLLAQRGEPFPQQTLVDWALELTDVLAYLHGRTPEPIIFRDLKPSNVMLKADGRLTLIDFGIARSFAPSQKGTMIGTEGYAPPEQYRGIADVRGDIYALGATLHHLATGSDPRGETPFTFAQRPPRRLNPALTPEFEQLILKCVAYSANDRYASIGEVRQALVEVRNQKRSAIEAVPAEQRLRTSGSRLLAVPQVRTGQAGTAPRDERLDWVVSTGDEIRGSASHGGGGVYFGSYDGHLYAVDEMDGSVRWRHRTQRGVVSKPLVADDFVIFGSEDHTVYAVTRQQARVAWTFRTSMPIRSSPLGDERACTIGSDDGFVYRIDRIRGTLLWRYRTWGPVRSTPATTLGGIVFGSDDGYIYCIDRETGQLRWRREIGTPVVSSPTPADRLLIVGAADGVVRGLAAESGSVVWSQATAKAVIASADIVDRTAYVGSADGTLYALDVATGGVSWKTPLCRQITSTATPDGEFLYVGGTDGVFYCLNREDGVVKWRYAAGGPIVAKPLVTADHIIFGGLDGKLYALHRPL